MKIEEIIDQWDKDSTIDMFELSRESIRVSKMHHKYLSMYTMEKQILFKHQCDMDVLRLEKQEFFAQGPSKETEAKGWKIPAKGALILKQDIPLYVQADPDIIAMRLKISLQQAKVDYLESVLKHIHNMGYNIKNAIDYMKFTAGN